MLDRDAHLQRVRTLLGRNPVVAILGPRQVGKTTLARQVASGWSRPVTIFDLEHPPDARRLEDPSAALADLRGLVIIDEVQRVPDLFPVLRVLADRSRAPARFLVLGSASPDLLRQSSETLAGRIAFHELTGFGLDEVGPKNLKRLWLRGGLPRAYTARTLEESIDWRRAFVRTFVERDLPQLGVAVASTTMQRFWSMLAHVHGQTLNTSELGRSLAVTDTTIRRYADALIDALVVMQLRPWHENLSKRQVKAPKVYIKDTGLLHTLLEIESASQLAGHLKAGASWEGLAIQQVIHRLGVAPEQCFFWATHGGAELDLLVIAAGRRLGFEIELTDAPSVTPSMRVALSDLRLDSLDVIHGGTSTYTLAKRVRAVALRRVFEDIKPLHR